MEVYQEDKHMAPAIAKWFKLAARAQALDAYWDPYKNT